MSLPNYEFRPVAGGGDQPQSGGNPKENNVPDEEVVVETPEAEVEEVVEEVVEETPKTEAELTEDQVDAWMKKNGIAGIPSSHPRFKEIAAIVRGEQKKEDDDDDEEEFVQRKDVKKAKQDAVSEMEERMTRRYAALDTISSVLNKYPDLPTDSRTKLMSKFQTLPVDVMETVISGGNIEQAAKAEMFDLLERGVIERKSKKAPSAAPTGGEPKSVGLRAKLSADQREILEQHEKEYSGGKQWSDEQIAEAFGVEMRR